jgi:hypothetical protein
MASVGRPRGLTINPAAVHDLLDKACISKAELCEAAGVKPGHLSDMLHRTTGASPAVVRRMAVALGCVEATIAPELAGRFVAVRNGDVPEPVAS